VIETGGQLRPEVGDDCMLEQIRFSQAIPTAGITVCQQYFHAEDGRGSQIPLNRFLLNLRGVLAFA
jgi:hypothetical protein